MATTKHDQAQVKACIEDQRGHLRRKLRFEIFTPENRIQKKYGKSLFMVCYYSGNRMCLFKCPRWSKHPECFDVALGAATAPAREVGLCVVGGGAAVIT